MNPSLLLIPDRYKASKLYSQIPDSGAGDLAFTRANDTATRVNSEGLIEKVRTNLYIYSQDYSNAAWQTSSATKVTTTAIDPNGGNTACNVTLSGGGISGIFQDAAFGGLVTVSFFVKSNGGGNKFRLFGDGTLALSADFTATSDWVRYSFSFTRTIGAGAGILVASDLSAADLLIAFGQYEAGDIATPYIPTTTAAVSVGPVADIPRIDYTGGGCGKLLLEPQRTNVLTFSEQFDNAAWGNAGAVTANAILSPDGFINADTVTGILSQLISFTNGTAYTFSVFAKKNSGNSLTLRADATSAQTCNFNLDTLVAGAGGVITDYGNGWYRCAFTFTANGTATGVVYILPPTSVYLYGCQLEVGSYASSYIPTLGASVTRSADAASKTGISSLIGQTSGTLFVDVDFSKININEDRIFINAETDSNNRITFAIDSGNSLRCNFIDSAVLIAITASPTWQLGRNKIAVAYANNDAVLFLNGNLLSTITTVSIPSTTQIQLGNFQNSVAFLSDRINASAVYTTRLSNADLQSLTTL